MKTICIECGQRDGRHLSGCEQAGLERISESYTVRIPTTDGGTLHTTPQFAAELNQPRPPAPFERFAIGALAAVAAIVLVALVAYDYMAQTCGPIGGC